MTPGLPVVTEALAVAGVGLRIGSATAFVGRSDPWYLPFIVEDGFPAGCTSAIDVEVATSPFPPCDAPLLFDGGIAWTMQPEDTGYRLCFRRGERLTPGEARSVHTVACSDDPTTHVKVYAEQDVEPLSARPGRLTNPVRYPLDQLLLMNHLASRGGVIVHAAGVVMGGGALAFPGVSGAGKSTLARLMLDAGWADSLLSDDRMILRAAREGDVDNEADVVAWGTPWPSDARVARNACAPLSGLLFLVKSEQNELVPLTPSEATRRLMPVVTCPWYDAERLPGVLDTCAQIVESTPCYEMRFRPDQEAVALLTEWAHENEDG